MPNNWQMVDSNFPTITGEEPVKEQIGKIIDYLSILTEQLQYQLQNLDSSNWNASALTELEQSAVDRLNNILKNLESTVNSIAGRISSAEGIVGRMTEAEETIGALDAAMTEHLEEFEKVREAIEGTDDTEETEGRKGIEERLSDAEKTIEQLTQLLSGVTVAEDETTVGGEGKTVHLIGTVYINGVLQGEAEKEETT